MPSDSERGVNPSKGLSFIDWESLGEEEYNKLNRIINTPHHGSRVQFPFPRETNTEVSLKAQVDPDVDHAPVFQPGVPPPSMVGYPIPVHWPPGNPGLASHSGGHYPMSVQGGYVFPNPALTASGEATVAFVTAISNGHPVYAYPGVGHFHGSPMPPGGMPMTVPITAQENETGVLPLPPSGQTTQPPLDLTSSSSQVPLSEPKDVPVTILQSGVSATLEQPEVAMAQPTQVVYMPQSQVETQASVIVAQEPDTSQSSLPSPQPPAVTGLPKTQTSSLEFGGPVVFDHGSDRPTHSEPNNNKLTTHGQSLDVKQDVVIDIDPNISPARTPSIIPDPTNTLDASGNNLAVSETSAGAITINTDNQNVASKNNPASPTGGLKSPESEGSVSSNAPLPSPVPAQTTVKSWSSLFARSSQGVKSSSVQSVSNSSSTPQLLANSHVDSAAFPAIGDTHSEAATSREEKSQYNVPVEKVASVGVHSDPLAQRLQDQICDLQIVHTPVVIQPRGLKNGQNTCFLNAPLQVLMGCPPFIHMFRSFKHLPTRAGSQSSTPILDSLIQFVNSFQNGQRIRNPGSRNKKGGHLDLTVGQAFIPEPLLSVAQNVLGLHIGVQHDAEEFLSQILSMSHEEMENILKMDDSNGVRKEEEKTAINGTPHMQENHKDLGQEEEDDDEAWQQVGPKNHHVETNVNDCGQTPVSSIFAGLSRSCLIRESGKTSDTLDSFFTLKLDIQAECVHSVKDALLRLNTSEIVHDADGRRVHGQRRMFFDVLPPVLIMHLKLFEYSNGNGQKIQKKVTFDVDLNIPKEIISRVGKTKYASPKSRNYKLFGVVNHHGRKMNDGHYTSDVFLPVASGWLRFDDSDITCIQEADVLYYSDRSMPYLLFYRRMDVS